MEFKIRKFKQTDIDALYALLSDPRVMEFLEPPYSFEKAIHFLNHAGLSDPPLIYAVDDAGGKFMGYFIYHSYDEDGMEIGWVLTPESWGKGCATALTLQLIKMAHNADKDAVIECVPAQRVTSRIALNCGFSYEGRSDGLDVYRRKKDQ